MEQMRVNQNIERYSQRFRVLLFHIQVALQKYINNKFSQTHEMSLVIAYLLRSDLYILGAW